VNLLDYAGDHGIVAPSLVLRDYQTRVLDLLEASTTRRNLVVMATGAGKTVVFAEYLRRSLASGRGLVLAHRDELIQQAADKIRALVPGLDIEIEKAASFATRATGGPPGVVVASIQTLRGKRLEAWPKDAFRVVVVDECFPAGTLVDGRPIESLRVRDSVSAFDERTMRMVQSNVAATMRSRPSGLVRVASAGRSVICTPGHPFYTARGWVPAAHLSENDHVVLHGVLSRNTQSVQIEARSIPRSGTGLLHQRLRDCRVREVLVGTHGAHESEIRVGTHEEAQSDAPRRQPRAHGGNSTADRSQAAGSRRERHGALTSGGCDAGGAWGTMATVVGANAEAARERVSDALQTRPGARGAEDRGGAGRGFTWSDLPQSAGREENSLLEYARVDGVEILEPGSDGTYGGLCRDGYVYNLEVERQHTYTANGFVVHNCHHAVAESYRNVFEHFGADPDGSTPLLGVTATAGRTDKIGLGAVFESITVDLGIAKLVESGWLVPVRAFLVRTKTSLDDVSTRAGDFAAGELEAAVDDEYRNGQIVAAYEEHAMGRQGIAYCAGVDHAHHLAGVFRARGISAESVWGAMEVDDRHRILKAFQAGEVSVLTNFGVLTEGFDAPNTACIIQARPTKSPLILTQMIGRGTRPATEIAGILDPDSPAERRRQIAASSKPDVLILDVVDKLSRGVCQSAASLAGLPITIDPQGADIIRMASAMLKLDPRLAARALCADDVRRFIDAQKRGLSLIEIDVLAATKPDPEVARHSDLTWAKLAEDVYGIELQGRVPQGERAPKFPFRLVRNTLGAWELVDGATAARSTIGDVDTSEAFRAADGHLRAEHPDKIALVDRSARWRQVPPSPKQREWLVNKGVFASDAAIPTGLTKGEATSLLDAAFAKRGRR
jgi:superfamily II DNA or RNA helicase